MIHAIKIQKLTKIYPPKYNTPGKIALDDIDLLIPRGSIFGLLGPNGAGKSTLINILANTVIKTAGKVEIFGIDIDDNPRRARKNIGIVPQEVVIDSFFPLHQALEFTAGYYGIRPSQRRTDEILQILGLYDKRDNLPRQLSGGMKRRFMVAKALVHSPKVLVLDEPTAGVDIELRDQLWKYVRKINDLGITIILTTHYLAEAEELCDEIAFINHGRIIKQDSKENLLNTLSAKYVDVEFASNKIQASFIKFNKVVWEMIGDKKIRFRLNSKNYTIGQLIADIHNLNLEITDLQIHQEDLESIFKKIIK